jgi:Mg2+/Co2+ transporter CorB
VNGMILEEIQDIPLPNTRVKVGNYAIDILDVQENMIKQVRIIPKKSLKESVGS